MSNESWLQRLKAAGKGGIRLDANPATRGRAWSMPVVLPADFTGATMRGQIRLEPDAAGAALAEFAVSGPVVADGTSTFTLSLDAGTGANSTGILPADADADGAEDFPFDILLPPDGGTEELLVGGILPVVGRITE